MQRVEKLSPFHVMDHEDVEAGSIFYAQKEYQEHGEKANLYFQPNGDDSQLAYDFEDGEQRSFDPSEKCILCDFKLSVTPSTSREVDVLRTPE